jgi:hypothetical protein
MENFWYRCDVLIMPAIEIEIEQRIELITYSCGNQKQMDDCSKQRWTYAWSPTLC